MEAPSFSALVAKVGENAERGIVRLRVELKAEKARLKSLPSMDDPRIGAWIIKFDNWNHDPKDPMCRKTLRFSECVVRGDMRTIEASWAMIACGRRVLSMAPLLSASDNGQTITP